MNQDEGESTKDPPNWTLDADGRLKRLELVVGQARHSNETLHRWVTVFLTLQTGLLVAVGAIFTSKTGSKEVLQLVVVCCIGILAGVSTLIVRNLFVRNRLYFGLYVRSAIKLDGTESIGRNPGRGEPEPEKENAGKPWGVQRNLTLLCVVVFEIWVAFVAAYVAAFFLL